MTLLARYLVYFIISSIISVILYRAFLQMIGKRNDDHTATLIWNIFGGGIRIAGEYLQYFEGFMAPIMQAFVDSAEANGGGIYRILHDPLKAMAQKAFTAQEQALLKAGESTPDNAINTAADAMGAAYGFGMASHGVTAAFEALFPEKINCFNSVGPMLEKLAGFEEVSKAALDSLYENAFGKSLEYHYRSHFRPELPKEEAAVNWHSKRLLTDDKLRALFEFSGLKREYEEIFVQAAYHTVSPRALSNLFEDTPFPREEVKHILEFSGIREQDISILLNAYEWNSTKNMRKDYVTALISAGEKGLLDQATIDSHLDTLHWSAQAKNYANSTIAIRRLINHTELYRKEVSILYETGQLSDHEYVPALEHIGMQAAEAESYYAIDAARLRGKVLASEERELAHEHAQLLRERTQAIRTQYLNGLIFDANYVSSMVNIGVRQADAEAFHAIDQAKLQGKAELDFERAQARAAADLQRERVASIRAAYLDGVMPVEAAAAALLAAGVPVRLGVAMLGHWKVELDAKRVDVFGVLTTRNKAVDIREKVAATHEQFVKKLLPLAAARQALASYGIPPANVNALLAEWEAQVYKVALPP